ncbi:hypothetical protein C8T65DRAFT_647499 [Cerioporus squamosus]|nr:hypothetical protein C8T65DRAFT_647499 [Cerioporus squamosus]
MGMFQSRWETAGLPLNFVFALVLSTSQWPGALKLYRHYGQITTGNLASNDVTVYRALLRCSSPYYIDVLSRGAEYQHAIT